MLAALVSYRTGCLACGLAGCLALAAAALLYSVLKSLYIYGLDMFHFISPLK